MQDIYYSIIFYLLFIGFGIIGFAVLFLAVPKHKVLIYTISKPIGLALVAYPIWILSSFKLLNFQNTLALQLVFFVALLASICFLSYKGYEKYKVDKNIFSRNWKFFAFILISEVISIALFAGYLYIKSFNPNLEGTEKFMDLNLLMSAGKTDYFPFNDSWWAGKTVNYYYYGFYLFAFATRLSGIPYSISYNLALGFIFIQCFITSAVIVYRLVRDILPALFGAILVTFAGNLHYAYCFVNNLNDKLNSECFYPKATRIIDPAYTINEFPSYSFVLGDLHPHVLSIPYFLVGTYLLLEIHKEEKFNWRSYALFAFIAGTAGLINVWDFMTLGFMLGIVVGYKFFKSMNLLRHFDDKFLFTTLGLFNLIIVCFTLYAFNFNNIARAFLSIAMTLFFTLFIVMFFKYRKQKLFYSFIYSALMCFAAATALIVASWQGFIVSVILLSLPFIGAQLFRKYRNNEINFEKKFLGLNVIALFIAAIAPFALYIPYFLTFKSPVTGVGFAPEYVAANFAKFPDMQYPSSVWFLFGIWGTYLILCIVSVITIVLLKKFRISEIFFPLMLVFVAIFLVWFTEVFFFQDLFHIANPPYFRANTVFKFTYHSWILIGIGTAILLNYCWQSLVKIKSVKFGFVTDMAYILLVSIIFTSVFLYPFIAYSQAFNPQFPWDLKGKQLTLDGSKYIDIKDPDDYATIQWLNQNQKERVVIVESVGSAYTYNARISVNTGMQNIINWETHEWTWRFHYPLGYTNWKQIFAAQAQGKAIDTGYTDVAVATGEVKAIYESNDMELTKKYLDKYKVKYIYVGKQERTTYFDIKDQKLNVLGKIVFQSGDSKLYKVTSND